MGHAPFMHVNASVKYPKRTYASVFMAQCQPWCARTEKTGSKHFDSDFDMALSKMYSPPRKSLPPPGKS